MGEKRTPGLKEERRASTANSSSGKSTGRGGAFSFPDHRPQVAQQRKLQEVIANSRQTGEGAHFRRLANAGTVTDAPVAQRMLVKLGSDAAQDINAQRLMESNPIEFREADISSLVQGEVLHLLAHSGGNDFAGMSPYRLFRYLIRQGLQAGNVTAIQLHGCESTDFATMLEHFLNKEDLTLGWTPQGAVKVKGIPGYSLVSTSGRNFSIGREKGNDEIWNQIKEQVNRNPSNERIKGYMQQFPGEIRKIKRLRSLRAVKGQLFRQVLQSLAVKVERVRLDDAFGRADLNSFAKMVDRIISIMQLPVAPLGDISRDHPGKRQNDIRKKIREINPPPPPAPAPTADEGFDLDLLGNLPSGNTTAEGIEQTFDFDISELDFSAFNVTAPANLETARELDASDIPDFDPSQFDFDIPAPPTTTEPLNFDFPEIDLPQFDFEVAPPTAAAAEQGGDVQQPFDMEQALADMNASFAQLQELMKDFQ